MLQLRTDILSAVRESLQRMDHVLQRRCQELAVELALGMPVGLSLEFKGCFRGNQILKDTVVPMYTNSS
jgi:hypothetical protein